MKGIDNKKENKFENELIVKSNRLITAIQDLTLSETRLIQLAVISARSKGRLAHNEPLFVSTNDFAEAFNLSRQNAYKSLLEAEQNLFDRRFRFLEDGEQVKSQWVTRVKYKLNDIGIEITLAPDVINEITKIDGYDNFFTSYRQGQTKDFTSAYSHRLFELVKGWENVGKTPVFDLNTFKAQMGIKEDEYPRMDNFKRRVLDSAIKEINEKTTYIFSYKQHKKGTKITGFSFTIKDTAPKIKKTYERQVLTITEAIELSQKIPGAYINESERDAIGRVMNYKDEEGRSVYFVKATKEDWEEHRNNKKKLTSKIEKKASDEKWKMIGNTLVDDIYITKHKYQDETYQQAKKRIEKELSLQLELELNRVQEDDRPLWEVLGKKI